MLESIKPNHTYFSPSGIRFHVICVGKHGQDCSWPMVVYTNLEPTKDSKTNEIWVIAESIFLKTFSEELPHGTVL
ncbi:hypothetical protein MZD04_gp413 [Pseudomonas phage Psa21]|uniref:Uncharacterized protein n=1 Tax=Pseudomonas phage Psa21 TaxID=2530023 RepID=A0A481W5Z8_9CAUD|nr:hypothetical protein MZD04_gp413 [Pseudomonas phage Psa21]QBJ02935.1 hypothetical protein PSA21_413 [Pseudomonas phage Psa21]